MEKINKIKKIQYSYHTTYNRYSENMNSVPSSQIQRGASDINITIDPKKIQY